MPGQQFLLAFDADFVEQDVARVAQQLVIVHRARRPVLGSAYFFSGAFLSSGLTSVFRSGLTSDLTSVFSTMAESAKAPSALASCTGSPLNGSAPASAGSRPSSRIRPASASWPAPANAAPLPARRAWAP